MFPQILASAFLIMHVRREARHESLDFDAITDQSTQHVVAQLA